MHQAQKALRRRVWRLKLEAADQARERALKCERGAHRGRVRRAAQKPRHRLPARRPLHSVNGQWRLGQCSVQSERRESVGQLYRGALQLLSVKVEDAKPVGNMVVRAPALQAIGRRRRHGRDRRLEKERQRERQRRHQL